MYEEGKDFSRFVEVDSALIGVRGLLMQRDPGTLMVDVDGTLKILSLGLVDRKIYSELEVLDVRGWEIMAVTNQSTKGHVVARSLGNLFDLPNYPDCFLKKGWPVFGGRWDFVWNHYKEGEKSVSEISNKVIESKNSGYLVMMGDEISDISFFSRLVRKIKDYDCQRESMFLKIPFLGMPRMDGPVLRRFQTVLP